MGKVEKCFIKNSESYTKLKKSFNLSICSKDVTRCRSKSTEADQIKFDKKCLALQRSNSKLTSLVVLKCHHIVCHCGVLAILCNFRNTYWMFRGRQKVKLILKSCVSSKIIQWKTLAPPRNGCVAILSCKPQPWF